MSGSALAAGELLDDQTSPVASAKPLTENTPLKIAPPFNNRILLNVFKRSHRNLTVGKQKSIAPLVRNR